jgi:hypothetical protein
MQSLGSDIALVVVDAVLEEFRPVGYSKQASSAHCSRPHCRILGKRHATARLSTFFGLFTAQHSALTAGTIFFGSLLLNNLLLSSWHYFLAY